MNLRIITKNHADDSKIGSSRKIDFKAEWTHESMPTAWVLFLIFEISLWKTLYATFYTYL